MADLITVFAHSPGLSGAERSLLETLPLLLARYRVDLIAPGPGLFMDRAHLLAEQSEGALRITQIASRFDYGHGVLLGPRALSHWLRNARALTQAVAHLRARPPVAIYSNSVASWLGARAARQLSLPHLWHLRELPLRSSIGRPRAGARAEVALLARGAHVANSAYVADWYAARHPITPRVAYQPVTLNLQQCLPRAMSTPLRLLCVGGLYPQKNYLVTLAALDHLPAALRRNVRLDILGEGPQRTILEAAITEAGLQGCACLPGAVTEVGHALANSDLLINSATNEAFGRVTAEAMIADVPVIGANSGGTAELLGVDGARGTLFTPGDPVALATQITAFAANPAPFAAAAAHARDWAKAHLSPVAYAAILENGIEDAIALARNRV